MAEVDGFSLEWHEGATVSLEELARVLRHIANQIARGQTEGHDARSSWQVTSAGGAV